MPARGVGEAADGRVRAVVARGRLQRLELDPRLMRLPEDDLGSLIATAVNTAFDELRSQSAVAEETVVADPAALAETLREVHNEGLRQMALISQSLNDGAI